MTTIKLCFTCVCGREDWAHVNPGCDDCDGDMTMAKTPISTATFISDPGHGWLVVTMQRLLAYGITEAMISPYSYRSPDGTEVALEEDCDAAVFLDAFAATHGAPPFINEEHEDACAIRNWPGFGTKLRSA